MFKLIYQNTLNHIPVDHFDAYKCIRIAHFIVFFFCSKTPDQLIIRPLHGRCGCSSVAKTLFMVDVGYVWDGKIFPEVDLRWFNTEWSRPLAVQSRHWNHLVRKKNYRPVSKFFDRLYKAGLLPVLQLLNKTNQLWI